MLDRDKDIRCQGQLKSIWEGMNHSLTDDPGAIMERVEIYLKFSLKCIESYAKLETPPQMPVLKDARQHLSDESVASEVKPKTWPKKEVAPGTGCISLKQRSRLYAIRKQAGWEDKAYAEFIFNNWGLMDDREMPWKIYEQVCEAVQKGPGVQA